MERVRRIETWARLGYVARGIVYILLGWIALSSGKALSTGETVQAFDDLPGGDLILILLAAGLFGYGFYKIYSAAVDLDDKGSDAKGWVVRASRVIGGIGYWVLAFIAARQIGGQDSAAQTGTTAGSDGAKQQAAEQVSQAAGGDLLLVLVGAGVLAMAAAQFWIAFKAKFMDEMQGAPAFVKPAGQVGYAARALVLTIVGWFIIRAGLDGERLRSFGDALAIIRNAQPLLFQLVAFGLILFGIASLAVARYRVIRDEDVIARLSQTISQ